MPVQGVARIVTTMTRTARIIVARILTFAFLASAMSAAPHYEAGHTVTHFGGTP